MKSVILAALICCTLSYQQRPKKQTAKKMSQQEEFYGTPMFLNLEDDGAHLGFQEHAAMFMIPGSEKHFNEWVAQVKKALKDKTKLKVRTSNQQIIALE